MFGILLSRMILLVVRSSTHPSLTLSRVRARHSEVAVGVIVNLGCELDTRGKWKRQWRNFLHLIAIQTYLWASVGGGIPR